MAIGKATAFDRSSPWQYTDTGNEEIFSLWKSRVQWWPLKVVQGIVKRRVHLTHRESGWFDPGVGRIDHPASAGVTHLGVGRFDHLGGPPG